MKPISGRRMCKVLEDHGWALIRTTRGSHRIYGRSGSPLAISVPVHGNKDLKPGTQKGIMRDAGLSDSDL